MFIQFVEEKASSSCNLWANSKNFSNNKITVQSNQGIFTKLLWYWYYSIKDTVKNGFI